MGLPLPRVSQSQTCARLRLSQLTLIVVLFVTGGNVFADDLDLPSTFGTPVVNGGNSQRRDSRRSEAPVIQLALGNDSGSSEVAPVQYCDTCDAPAQPACASPLFENLSVFLGLEGSKQPQDFGVNAHFGGRFHVNWGLPLWEEQGIGIQVGSSINSTDNAVQVFERIDGTSDRFQNFTTIGIFQRADSGLIWAVGYDYLFQDYYDDFSLGQWRGDVGFAWDEQNEFGTWFALSGSQDHGSYAAIPMTLSPINQGNLYWRRTWENDAQTTFWLGIAEGHGEVNLALGDLPPTDERLVFGADIFVPLNQSIALFGQANFISPADTGTVDAYLGIAFYPGGSHGARNRKYAPRLPVANNTTFANDFSRR